ncbi:hypothetical protein PROFUN_10677 [Planoprotostelium fungivorum]|uniref:Uncharacterized protein n=1 Tax=Planoprotostelium fungivorum TaxID=1890364 RepID=A0A2P6MTW2_9EUKA|nr:hypothetical protein PROFUN_15967 [Planoprotostelium fungivorum]PRP75499.1 hypothetical protein PROFUN_10677 [Planoprotostelium fungivorum]
MSESQHKRRRWEVGTSGEDKVSPSRSGGPDRIRESKKIQRTPSEKMKMRIRDKLKQIGGDKKGHSFMRDDLARYVSHHANEAEKSSIAVEAEKFMDEEDLQDEMRRRMKANKNHGQADELYQQWTSNEEKKEVEEKKEESREQKIEQVKTNVASDWRKKLASRKKISVKGPKTGCSLHFSLWFGRAASSSPQLLFRARSLAESTGIDARRTVLRSNSFPEIRRGAESQGSIRCAAIEQYASDREAAVRSKDASGFFRVINDAMGPQENGGCIISPALCTTLLHKFKEQHSFMRLTHIPFQMFDKDGVQSNLRQHSEISAILYILKSLNIRHCQMHFSTSEEFFRAINTRSSRAIIASSSKGTWSARVQHLDEISNGRWLLFDPSQPRPHWVKQSQLWDSDSIYILILQTESIAPIEKNVEDNLVGSPGHKLTKKMRKSSRMAFATLRPALLSLSTSNLASLEGFDSSPSSDDDSCSNASSVEEMTRPVTMRGAIDMPRPNRFVPLLSKHAKDFNLE